MPWQGGQHSRRSNGGWQTVAPSALPFAADGAPPLALDEAGLQRIRNDFVSAAQRAHRLGMDVIELHAAHGYLLHQFLSPLSNTRDDQYGGSLENRMRFPLEVFEAIRAAVPDDKPVGMRISATDWVDGGWDIEQSVVFAKELQRRGCAFIDVSSGGLSPLQQIPLEPGYQVPFAERIRRETGLPTIAVGLITEPEQAEKIVVLGPGRHGGAGPRHAVRPALAMARSGKAGRPGDRTETIFALATARVQKPVQAMMKAGSRTGIGDRHD